MRRAPCKLILPELIVYYQRPHVGVHICNFSLYTTQSKTHLVKLSVYTLPLLFQKEQLQIVSCQGGINLHVYDASFTHQGALQIPCDAALFELIILKEQVSAISNTPVYPPLCEYLKNPSQFSSQNTRLFARLLCCSEDDVSEKLATENPAQRVKNVATQLHNAGLRMEAGSLVLSAQVFHPALATMNSALAYIADRLFQH